MNKEELKQVADIRVKEAGVLLSQGYYQGAYYLAGYAVECLLKACITNQIKAYDFPDKKLANDCYTHNLSKLLETADLKSKMAADEKQNEELKLNWACVKEWSEESRYKFDISEKEAQDLFNAIVDTQSGIVSWLKNCL
jgi:HEPN domain-containing protein